MLDDATLGLTPPPLGLTRPIPGIEQLYRWQTHPVARHMLGTLGPYTPSTRYRAVLVVQTHPAARHMLGTLGLTPLIPGIEQFWTFQHAWLPPTLGLTTTWTMSDQFSPIITVFDRATLGLTPPIHPPGPALAHHRCARCCQGFPLQTGIDRTA